jgi:DNA-binding LytR/AlgR family response regulator
MKCIIIDDENLAQEILRAMIERIPYFNIVGVFSSAIEAMKFLNKNSVDLIFLDIHMPTFTGFDMIQTIKNPPQVILVTSDENLAIDAFEYECITDYLVKPLELERFNRSIERVVKKKEVVFQIDKPIVNNVNEIYVNINSRLIKLEIEKISTIEANGDYIAIKSEGKKYVVHTTLKKIAEKLPENHFFQIHRSHIINIKKIVDIQDNSVLIDNEIIPISKKNKPNLLKILNLL